MILIYLNMSKLRKIVRALATDKKYRHKIKVVTRLFIILCVLWILSFPYMSRKVFTSENAIRARLTTEFGKDEGEFVPRVRQIQREVKKNQDDLKKHIMMQLTDNFEVYEQDKYIYSYIRSEGGYGNECSLITFPINYAASVTIGLSFLEEWKRIKPKWLSKDLIILFYEEEDYASSVREFL